MVRPVAARGSRPRVWCATLCLRLRRKLPGMRCVFFLLPLLLLAACGASPVALTSVAGGVTAGSVAVLHRTPFDALWSLVTGRDCSMVRLDQGKSWCRPQEPKPSAAALLHA